MSTVGAFTVVWRESRYFPLILEQLERVPGPVVIVHCDRPMFWYGEGPAPSGHNSKVGSILEDWEDALNITRKRTPENTDIRKMREHISTEDVLRNYATKRLREMGADVALWCDSDMILDLPDMDRLVAAMVAENPACWTVGARHLWRNWQTTYSRGNFRMGYPTAATWNDGSFERSFEETARHADVVVWHPSYVLSDQEVHDKLSSWFHAPLAKDARWWERWQSREWDAEQDLQPLDLPVPAGIAERLERWNCIP